MPDEKDKLPVSEKTIDPLDLNKTILIAVAMITLTAALFSGRMSEAVYSGLMGSFLAFTFGRIFSEQITFKKP
jgi:hypothetical protein